MHFDETTASPDARPHEGLEQLLALMPVAAGAFGGTEYPRPASMAFFGEAADAARLRKAAEERIDAPAPAVCALALAIAEVIESVRMDRAAHFITDAKARDLVFMGAKWRAGWVFLMGAGPHDELAAAFRAREFLVFCQNGAGMPDVVDLGPRQTAAVYFLQLMVRYAMVWGGIAPGDDHEMGHFLEADMPGVVVAHGALMPVEELLLLGLMKLGASAVVPPSYPFEQGRQVRAEGVDEIVTAAVRFPNLRVREADGGSMTMPGYCDPLHAREPFECDRVVGGATSFFVLVPAAPGATAQPAELPAALDPGGPVGIVVTVADARLDVATSGYLEEKALDGIHLLHGVRAERNGDDGFRLFLAREADASPGRIAGAVAAGLKRAFPLLEGVAVEVFTGPAAAAAKQRADAFRAERARCISSERDDTAPHFHYCIECQPFSREHVCIVTPDRPPMCGRDRFQVKAAALFGATWHPFKRQDVPDGALRGALVPGTAIDAATGEYQSVNDAVRILSHGAVTRMTLHSVRSFPHTSCGCFRFLAFWIEGLDGIGVMERNYEGEAPGRLTWNILANRAGGKQSPGVTGVSEAYLRSPRFLKGDGGHAAIRWVSPKAYEAVKDLLPEHARVRVG
ncbi:hypothetical protein GX586_00770 [bacterium]|nr:hypothetical protein [bacterium]